MSRVSKKFLKLGTTTGELSARDIPANYTPASYVPAQAGAEGADKISAHLKGLDQAISSAVAAVSGDIGLTAAPLTHNQGSPTNITGLAFNNAVTRSAHVHYCVVVSATSDVYEAGTLVLVQKSSGWDIAHTYMGDSTGIVFSVTSTGQVQYTCPAFSGFSSATIKFRADTTTI